MATKNYEKYQTLANRYTKALFATAQENNMTEKIANELSNIAQTFAQNPDIESFFVNPTIKIEDKTDILDKSFKNNIDEKLYNFLNILNNKNRMFLIPDIANLYEHKIKQINNILEVEVTSAIELDEKMKSLLISKLEQQTGKKIELKNNIDKSIIGGLILTYNDKTIDGSIKTQLKRLQMEIK